MMEIDPEIVAKLREIFSRDAGPEPVVPEPAPPVELPKIEPMPAPPAKRKRARVYSPARRGFMRSSREEGVAEELAEMQAEASGSPLFSSFDEKADQPSDDRAEVMERLRKLASSSKPPVVITPAVKAEAAETEERRHRDKRKRPDPSDESGER